MERGNTIGSGKNTSGGGNGAGTRDPEGDGDGDGGGGRWSSDVDVEWLSQETNNYSGADLSSLVRNAAMAALREQVMFVARGENGRGGEDGVAGADLELELELARRHFEAALESTCPSSGAEAIAKHGGWAQQWHVG